MHTIHFRDEILLDQIQIDVIYTPVVHRLCIPLREVFYFMLFSMNRLYSSIIHLKIHSNRSTFILLTELHGCYDKRMKSTKKTIIIILDILITNTIRF